MLDFDQLQTPVWIYDIHNFRICWANESAQQLWIAESAEELFSRDFREETSDAVYETLLSYLDEFAKGKTISRWWQLNPRNQLKDVYCRFSGTRLDDGRMAMLVEGIEYNEELIGSDFGGSSLLALCDENGTVFSISPSLRDKVGHRCQRLEDILQYPEQSDVLLQITLSQGYHQEDIRINTLKGSLWHSIELRRIDKSDEVQISITMQDIHVRKHRELEHQAMALLDPLTGSLNRNGLIHRVQPMITGGRPFTLYYLDLDGFKPINDSYGHAAGDELLNEVAVRLIDQVGDEGLVARVGGDEFVIIVPADQEADISVIAQHLLSSVAGSYAVKSSQVEVSLSASLGSTRYPEDDVELPLLLANADSAMYNAKSQGRRRWIQYSQGMREQFHRKTHVSQLLTKALEQEQLGLEYQPVIDAADCKLILVEALLRWRAPDSECFSPEELIDAAEHCGLIGELSCWIYNKACKDFSLMRKRLAPGAKLSINISPLHIMQGGFIEALQTALELSGLTPNDLVLELTEKVMLPGSSEFQSVIPELIELGFDIAIDDFGTGFSSLAYLQSIPANWVKLDREFVQQMGQGTQTIEAIYQLVSGLNMQMIVEGIETQEQLNTLSDLGIRLVQGYHLFGAMAAEQLSQTREADCGCMSNQASDVA